MHSMYLLQQNWMEKKKPTEEEKISAMNTNIKIHIS